jgi:Ca2+-binding RTX toxin-like protein
MGKLARTLAKVATAIVLVAMAPIAVPAGAGAATTFGATNPPNAFCAGIFLQAISPGNQYAAPFDGVITSWSYQAGARVPEQLKLKVARPEGGNDFTMIGESAVVAPAPNTLNSYPTRIAVKAGDVLGFYAPGFPATVGFCWADVPPTTTGYEVAVLPGDIVPPTRATFNRLPPSAQLDVSAVLELGCNDFPATVVGTSGSDVGTASSRQDVIVAQGGNDTLSGLAGNDMVCGGSGMTP